MMHNSIIDAKEIVIKRPGPNDDLNTIHVAYMHGNGATVTVGLLSHASFSKLLRTLCEHHLSHTTEAT